MIEVRSSEELVKTCCENMVDRKGKQKDLVNTCCKDMEKCKKKGLVKTEECPANGHESGGILSDSRRRPSRTIRTTIMKKRSFLEAPPETLPQGVKE